MPRRNGRTLSTHPLKPQMLEGGHPRRRYSRNIMYQQTCRAERVQQTALDGSCARPAYEDHRVVGSSGIVDEETLFVREEVGAVNCFSALFRA